MSVFPLKFPSFLERATHIWVTRTQGPHVERALLCSGRQSCFKFDCFLVPISLRHRLPYPSQPQYNLQLTIAQRITRLVCTPSPHPTCNFSTHPPTHTHAHTHTHIHTKMGAKYCATSTVGIKQVKLKWIKRLKRLHVHLHYISRFTVK